MKSYRELSSNNSALSPVIGEILLIAIVVVLGAIIASYAFGTTKPLQDNNLIGMSVDKINEDNIVVTFMGGGDADKVLHLYVSVNGSYHDGTDWSTTRVDTFNGTGVNPIEIGKTVLLIDNADNHIKPSRDKVIITAEFIDGTEQVVYDASV
jgi:flagellin-like protein